MKTVKTTKTKPNSFDYTLPGLPLTDAQLVAIVKEAEKGPFTDIEVAEKEFEEWKRKLKD